MKAAEWADKFNGTPAEEWVAILGEYGKETAELVAVRSKTSGEKTKLSAMEGAVGEQRNKFKAIINRVPTLAMDRFDEMLKEHAPDYLALKVKAVKVKEVEQEKVEKDSDSGRKLAHQAKPSRNRLGSGPRK